MNNYLTDPLIWKRFHKNMEGNKFNAYSYRRLKRKNQLGRGLHGRFRHSYMIPVNVNANDTETNSISTTMVSPVVASEDRATSEMKDVKEKKKPHVKVSSIIKRKNKKKKLKTKKERKQSTSKTTKKRTRRASKKKFNKDYYDNVWSSVSVKKKRKR